MCQVYADVTFCTCSDFEIDQVQSLKNYWVLYRYNEALNETTIGIAIKTKYSINVIFSNDNSSVEFILKDGEIQTDADMFWLGWFSNQYFGDIDI